MERDRVNDTLRQMKDATMSGGVLTTLCMLGVGGQTDREELAGSSNGSRKDGHDWKAL